jgi:hypothetical protein
VQLREEGHAVPRADVHVEDDDLRTLPRGDLGRVLERGRLERTVSGELEVEPAEEADRGVVVDDQDREGGHGGRV